MEVIDLQEELNNLRSRGVGLNLDERMQLELALHKLHTEIHAEEVLLWGKITGIKNDYFIAMGLTYTDQFEFLQKKFYYCLSNDYSFMELPDLNDQHVQFINRDKTFFTGEPNRKLKQNEGDENPDEPPPEDGNEDGDGEGKEGEAASDVSEAEEIKVPPKDLTEKDRVRFVVCAIENDC